MVVLMFASFLNYFMDLSKLVYNGTKNSIILLFLFVTLILVLIFFLFTKNVNDTLTILLVYNDDIILPSNNYDVIHKVKCFLNDKLKIKDLD